MALAIVTDIGKINIPEDIIGTIAGYAAMENYGIIGMCARTAGDAFLELLGGDNVQNIDICAGYPFRSGELVELLKLESENEHSSGENIYPEFADIAQEEGYKDVANLFRMVADVEKGHERILKQLHEELKGKTLYKCCEGEGCFKCDECGTVQTGKCAPMECPLCHQPQGYYRINITMNRAK